MKFVQYSGLRVLYIYKYYISVERCWETAGKAMKLKRNFIYYFVNCIEQSSCLRSTDRQKENVGIEKFDWLDAFLIREWMISRQLTTKYKIQIKIMPLSEYPFLICWDRKAQKKQSKGRVRGRKRRRKYISSWFLPSVLVFILRVMEWKQNENTKREWESKKKKQQNQRKIHFEANDERLSHSIFGSCHGRMPTASKCVSFSFLFPLLFHFFRARFI